MPLVPSTCEAETELSLNSRSKMQVPGYQVYTENSVSEKQKQTQQTLFDHLWLSLTGKLGLEEYSVFYPPNGKCCSASTGRKWGNDCFCSGLVTSHSVLKMEHKVSPKIFLPSVKGIF